MSRATHHFLALLREFDLRQGWKEYGNTDCAQWLNWRCGITRVVTDVNETELLQQALDLSADGLEVYCRQLRNADEKGSARDARRLLERYSLTRQIREDGSGVIYAELPAEDLALVMQAIDIMVATLPKDSNRSLFATAADGLVMEP